MATQNNLHVSDDLLSHAQRLAKAQGRSADDVAAEALERYLAQEWLANLDREGSANRTRLGLTTNEEVQDFVERAIAESRPERHG